MIHTRRQINDGHVLRLWEVPPYAALQTWPSSTFLCNLLFILFPFLICLLYQQQQQQKI